MSLDELYEVVKKKDEYPLTDKEQVQRLVSGVEVVFENHLYDETDIAAMIDEYPIQSPSEFLEIFIRASETYSPEEDFGLEDDPEDD